MENVFEKGCLIELKTSVWTGKAKLPSGVIEEADPRFVTASKFLIDKDFLSPIEAIRNEARTWIYHKTLPFPIKGVLFIPKDMIETVDNKLKQLKEQFNVRVNDFTRNYSSYIEQAKGNLGEFFNEADYPRNVSNKFDFDWSFFVMEAPGRSGLLSPDLYAREQEKFRQTMNEFQSSAMQTLRETFSEMVNRVVDRLRDNKRFKESTVENLREFVNDFEKLNITNDTELGALVGKCKAALHGQFTAQNLRDDESLRTSIAGKMAEVQEAMLNGLTEKPIRKLKIA